MHQNAVQFQIVFDQVERRQEVVLQGSVTLIRHLDNVVLDIGFLVGLAKSWHIDVCHRNDKLNAHGLQPLSILSSRKVADVKRTFLPLPGLQN